MPGDLLALSPLDERYLSESGSLREYFSEFGFIRARVRIEIAYFISLSRELRLIRDRFSSSP